MQPSPQAVESVRRCVRSALADVTGETAGDADFHLPAGLEPDDFLAAVARHRVTEVLADNISKLALPATVIGALRGARQRHSLRVMSDVHQMRSVQCTLHDASVPHLMFKGVVLAALTTGDYTARGHGDVDVWVPPESVPAAYDALTTAGWATRAGYPPPSQSWAWRHLLRTSHQIPMGNSHSEVDLHWRLHPTVTALPSFETAWSRRRSVSLGPVQVDTLGPVDTFTHSCSHAHKDDFRWVRSLVDIHRLAAMEEIWTEHDPHLSTVEEEALAVCAATIGLPEGMGAPRQPASSRRCRAAVRRGLHAQVRPVPMPGQNVPGAQFIGTARRSLAGARSSGDLVRVLSGLSLPAAGLGDLPDPSAPSAIPRALLRRVRYVSGRARPLVLTRRRPAGEARSIRASSGRTPGAVPPSTWWTLRRRARTLEACIVLAAVTTVRRNVALHRWSWILGPVGPVSPDNSAGSDNGVDLQVALAVAAAAWRLPVDTTCLDRAVAGAMMLRRRGRHWRLVIGMPRDDPRGTSHAWLVGESGWVVVGDGELERFRPVTQFG